MNELTPDGRREPDAEVRSVLWSQLIGPVKALRARYLPLLLIYFAYGALGIIDVSRDWWVKEDLSLSPAELASAAVWFTLPWAVKVVFGELADSVPIFGSRRRSYVLIGAALQAVGLVTLAGTAGRWIQILPAEQLYILSMLAVVLGTVIQDVVADAMSTEVVSREDDSGRPREESDVRADLGMVQVLGRLSLSLGILAVAGLSGVLAGVFSRETVFLIGLAVPVMAVVGAFAIRYEPTEVRPVNRKILLGGLGFAAVVVALGFGGVPYAQEISFVLSMLIVIAMLLMITREISPETRRAIIYTTIIIFAFRATPTAGDGYFWWTLDVLGFDETFYGVLRQTSAIIGIVALWFLAKQLTQYSAAKTLFWLTIAGFILSFPSIALYFGLHEWTSERFGFGARTIALVDAVAASPFAQLSMIPLLTLIAFYAPAAHRATWFALMASLMNLALVAGQLSTKYLNLFFSVARGAYDDLGMLLIVAAVIAFVLPMTAILVFGRRV